MRSLIIVFCLTLVIKSQSQNPLIKNLVFEGAGIRGIAYCGAIQQLEENGMMQNNEKVGGTSAGAIMALAISLGYSSEEITGLIAGTDFRKFNDGRFFFIGALNRVNKYFGWYRGKQFEQWLGKIIKEKTGNAYITFRELRIRGFRDLHITGTCLTKQKLMIFNSDTYPNMRILDAVRISMSIPLYFEAVFVNEEGKVVNHPKNKAGLDLMIDGGFTGNYPISMFDPESTDFNTATLGFRIDSEEQILSGTELSPMPVNNFNEYIAAFYKIVLENLNRQQLKEEDWKRTVSISDGDIGPRIRKLSTPEIESLILNGRNATKKYLEQN